MNTSTRPALEQRAGRVALRVLELEKKAFDRAAERVGSLQASADKTVQNRVESAKWVPKEGKLLVTEWIHTMKRGRGDLRRAVDTTFDLSTEFVKRVSEPAVKSKKRAPIVRKKVVRRRSA